MSSQRNVENGGGFMPENDPDELLVNMVYHKYYEFNISKGTQKLS